VGWNGYTVFIDELQNYTTFWLVNLKISDHFEDPGWLIIPDDFKEIGRRGMDCIQVGQHRVQRCTVVNRVVNIRICGEFLEQLTD
jgi:hypothetical protein